MGFVGVDADVLATHIFCNRQLNFCVRLLTFDVCPDARPSNTV